MTTVFDVIKKVAEDLPGSYITGVADSGSTTTIVDGMTPGGESDDIWNHGTALIYYDAAGLGAAPTGESAIIADYTGASGTVVLEDPGLSAQVDGGDRYGLVKPRYRRSLIVDKMHDALSEIKLQFENTTLTTADSTKTYTLPDGITERNLLWVEIATRTSAPLNYERVFDYWPESSALHTHTLTFKAYPISGYTIRLTYWSTQSNIYNDDDVLDDRIHIDLISAMTLRRVLEWRYQKFSVPPDRITNALNAALRREADAMRRYKVPMKKETPKISPPSLWKPDTRVPYPPVN